MLRAQETTPRPTTSKSPIARRCRFCIPDKFAGNEKLQNRATESSSSGLQEAYDLPRPRVPVAVAAPRARPWLAVGARPARLPAHPALARALTPRSEMAWKCEYLTEAEIKARLAGIMPPPRAQLVAQRDCRLRRAPQRPGHGGQLARWPRCSPSGGLSASSA
ncbi:MAG: hypothetical protein ACLTSX_13770 [Collinsella sp.]